MAVELHVREVREALYRASGGPQGAGEGQPSTALLGHLFHETFAALAGPGRDRPAFAAALEDAEPALEAWQAALVHEAYRRVVGPRLREHQAVLRGASAHVLSFWRAVRELGHWLAELHWTARAMRSGPVLGSRPGLDDPAAEPWAVAVEQPLSWELREPGWAQAVRLSGVADSVLRIPGTGRWCVVELKLGRSMPEADLGQVCLYHQMLYAASRNGRGSANRGSDLAPGTLALVGFEPERRERLFEAHELEEAEQRLKALIGRVAGVVAEPGPAVTTALTGAHGPTAIDDREGPSSPAVVALPEPSAEHVELGRKLVQTLEEYGARITLDGPPRVGPTFLRFPVELGPGVTLGSVRSRTNEIRVRLELEAPPSITIERGQVVVDLQRPDRQFVRFADIRPQLPEGDPIAGSAQVPLGVDLEGRLRLADLARPEHAHLLVAGTTGSGKSEWLRSALAGLLAANRPETLRLVLIDPKRTAFPMLRDSPFLLVPIVYPDERSIVEVLHGLVDEMEDRYRRMSETETDSLAEYIRKVSRPVPRIACVCDEYADLILHDRDERKRIEQEIARLGAKARAAGIHLILATQQPSREILKGTLDANIPARVALKMEKSIESRMLLGTPGAETLLGYGDLLFKDIGAPIRLQSACLAPEERERAFRPNGSVEPGQVPVGS